MVVFTCQNCNSCLKKKAVDLHLLKCKNPLLTCIDCLKDFDSRSYVGHLTCITENERYGGQDFIPSSAMQKQNQWCKSIQQVLQTNLSPPVLKNIIEFASENPNCPKAKKKFVNFILNNKIFFKAREAAEKSFDIILAEYNKSVKSENEGKDSDSKVNDSSDKSGAGKRKTISETEVHETETENTTNSAEKTSKKKNKESNNGVEQTNGFTKKSGNVNQNKNKKKDKRNNLTNGNSEEVLEESHEEKAQNGDNHSPDSTQSKKKKKKNKDKHLKNLISEQTSTEENVENDQLTENDHLTKNDHQVTVVDGEKNGPSDLLKDEDLSKLSKKERKKLLKQKKYEAEIVSIENYKKEDEVTEVQEEQVDKRKKKKKKHQTEEEEAIRQQKSSISEPEDKKIRLEVEEEPEEVVEKPKKFKWDEVILQVLQTQDDGEMSLKRLSKKVCAEYTNVYGERESYEEVMLKFNKKVLRTPGVRVLKDRAKLLSDS